MSKESAGATGSATYTVSDAIVEGLVGAGVTAAYGVVSIHNLPIYEAMERNGAIRIVPARGESGAVNMADAHARVSGGLGVAITSTGTGAGNAAGSLMEAWSAGTPVIHITGQVHSAFIGTGQGYIHDCKDQLGMLESVGKAAFRLGRPNEARAVISAAINTALTPPRGPVSIEIPIDVQTQACQGGPFFFESAHQISRDEHGLEDALELLKVARRPVIWAGGGAVSSGAGEEIAELAEKLCAPVITSQAGRGLMPENHPLCIGNFANFPEVSEFLQHCDLLLSVGVRFRSNETSAWRTRVPNIHIGIDADLRALNRNYGHSLFLHGDARGYLTAILSRLSGVPSVADDYRREIARVRDGVRTRLRKQLGPYETIMDAMRYALPRDAVIVRDVTVPSSAWGSRLLEIYQTRSSVHAAGGGIGQGLPMAIGAQIAAPDATVMLMVGDGGFLVNVGELATMAQENLPILIVLFDDGGYEVLRNIQENKYKRHIAVDLKSPDFVKLSESFGIETAVITSHAQFPAIFEQMVSKREPALIVIDMSEVGQMAEAFAGPPGV